MWKFTALILVAFAGAVALPQAELWIAMKGTSSPNPDHPTIVMIGDSHMEFVNWRLLLNCNDIGNYGVGGNTSAQILERLPDVLKKQPKLIITMMGGNDIVQGVSDETTIANFNEIKKEVTEQNIAFVSIAPPPARNHGSNTLLAAATSMTVPFTDSDLLDDGTHLRRSGYAKWRDAISPTVKRFCNR